MSCPASCPLYPWLKPNGAFPISENASVADSLPLSATRVKGHLQTMPGPDSPDTVRRSYEKMSWEQYIGAKITDTSDITLLCCLKNIHTNTQKNTCAYTHCKLSAMFGHFKSYCICNLGESILSWASESYCTLLWLTVEKGLCFRHACLWVSPVKAQAWFIKKFFTTSFCFIIQYAAKSLTSKPCVFSQCNEMCFSVLDMVLKSHWWCLRKSISLHHTAIETTYTVIVVS